jgi:hypothetical protein
MKANENKKQTIQIILSDAYTHSNSGIYHRQMRVRANKEKENPEKRKKTYLNVTR